MYVASTRVRPRVPVAAMPIPIPGIVFFVFYFFYLVDVMCLATRVLQYKIAYATQAIAQ